MEVASSDFVVYSCAWSAFHTCQIIFTRMEVLDCNFDSLLDLEIVAQKQSVFHLW